MVRPTLQLPGGITGFPAEGELLYLMPDACTRTDALRLAAHTHRLGRVLKSHPNLARCLPVSEEVRWSGAAGTERLPLPAVVAPQGMPVEQWLADPQASATGLIALMRGLLGLLDGLSAEGYLVEPFGLDGVWVQHDQVTWLPAVLQ